MTTSDESFESFLRRRQVSRRGFLKFCGVMAATLALPTDYAGQIARALAVAPRLPIVWLEFQDCTGDTESFLRAGARADPLQSGVTDPNLTALLLDYLSVDYHETLMTPSGAQARKSLDDTLKNHAGQFILVVEGAIPTALNGAYCTIAGETALITLQRVSALARATIALGSCAYDGGLAAAAPNPTGATGVAGAVPGVSNLINLPGCPSNVVNLAASLVYFLTFQRWPDLDRSRRPYFAYGNEIHEECERHDFYEQGRFVLTWGDAGHRQGWCLFRMGCKGPVTRSNCNQVKWNDGTNWPIGAGHGCVGCTGDKFWDQRMPAYTPLPGD